jgi:hypothetical protein
MPEFAHPAKRTLNERKEQLGAAFDLNRRGRRQLSRGLLANRRKA